MAKKGTKNPKVEFDMEDVVARGLELLRMGYYPTKICYYLHQEYGVPFNRFPDVKEAMKKELKERTDIVTEYAKEVQLERLHALLEDTISQSDMQMALKTIAEINKVLGVYEQKVKVETTAYKLEV